MRMRFFWLLPLLMSLAACGTFSSSPAGRSATGTIADRPLAVNPAAQEVVFYALSLMDTGYRFGGKNPEAGLDCSGMVAHVFAQASPLRLSGSAADIATRGRPVEREALRPGDLVFFNTSGRPFSHVGIYIGEDRFIHAPSSRGRVRVDRMDASYFAQRFEAARTYFD
ncbi:MAG TPA: C40 family peptidase [Rhodocyclaceae bacterium]|nr:C40 family peptidase [Rhodocyclaceae bacterium]